MIRKILQIMALVVLSLSGIAGCGTMGIPIFDPTDYVRDYTPRQVDWTRAPLSVTKNTARLDKELQEAQRNYDATRNAGRDDARAAAEHDFYNQLPRGANAPSFYCGEVREAYNQRFDELLREYRSRLEQGARQLGELEFYRSRQPR